MSGDGPAGFRRTRVVRDWAGRVLAVLAAGDYQASSEIAAVAQLVEHLIRNEGVGGSSPFRGTSEPAGRALDLRQGRQTARQRRPRATATGRLTARVSRSTLLTTSGARCKRAAASALSNSGPVGALPAFNLGELRSDPPVAAVEIRGHGRALRLDAQARPALPAGADPGSRQ